MTYHQFVFEIMIVSASMNVAMAGLNISLLWRLKREILKLRKATAAVDSLRVTFEGKLIAAKVAAYMKEGEGMKGVVLPPEAPAND